MKKIFSLAAIVLASMTFNSCGMGTTGSTAATNLATAVLTGQAANNGGSSLLTSVLNGAGQNVVGTVLSTLLKGSSASATSIQGTWTYSAPKVVFESQNVLAQLGSSVASSKIESTLKSQLTKMGFKAGKTTITLNEDKTCVFSLNGKTANGTYTYDPNTSLLTITGALGVTSTTCHCTLNGSELYMLFDADKLLSVATTMSAAAASTATLSSLLSSYSGLKLGWALTK